MSALPHPPQLLLFVLLLLLLLLLSFGIEVSDVNANSSLFEANTHQCAAADATHDVPRDLGRAQEVAGRGHPPEQASASAGHGAARGVAIARGRRAGRPLDGGCWLCQGGLAVEKVWTPNHGRI